MQDNIQYDDLHLNYKGKWFYVWACEWTSKGLQVWLTV
jgi:hypothetical protein